MVGASICAGSRHRFAPRELVDVADPARRGLPKLLDADVLDQLARGVERRRGDHLVLRLLDK